MQGGDFAGKRACNPQRNATGKTLHGGAEQRGASESARMLRIYRAAGPSEGGDQQQANAVRVNSSRAAEILGTHEECHSAEAKNQTGEDAMTGSMSLWAKPVDEN